MSSDIANLATLVPADVTAVAGVPRSGLLVAAEVAIRLGLPLYTVNGHLAEVGHGHRLKDQRKKTDPTRGKLLLLDDSVNTGHAIESALSRVSWPGGVITGCLYFNPDWSRFQPDLWAQPWPMPHLFEWHFFGSNLVTRAAFDLDGILAQDCPPAEDDDGPRYLAWLRTVKPRWLVRPHRVPLIVTARLEKYRSDTEAWLDRHGVSCDRLVMGPWADIRERSAKYRAAEYKGGEFARSGLAWFIESCPVQAKEIATAMGRPVICPPTGEVFQ